MSKVVLTYGTFDLFNVGHLQLINHLSTMGHKLVVGVSTDEFSAERGETCVIPYADRAAIVAAIRGVDLVIPDGSWEQKPEDIRTHNITHLAMGAEWKGRLDSLRPFCEVVYLEPTDEIRTIASPGQ